MSRQDLERKLRAERWRTSDTGCFRFNRDFTRIGVGRITRSSRTTNEREFNRRNDILTKLAESAQIDALKAFRNGAITIEQLVDADREQRLKSADLLGVMMLQRDLWAVVTETLPRMGTSDGTRKRYEVSIAALRRKLGPGLGTHPTIGDLERVQWRELREKWGRSPADWNHLRRAMSAFLTTLLGDKFHPFRRRIVRQIPIAVEAPRVPDVTPSVFWQILRHIPASYQACFIAIAGTGMRVGEYLSCTRFCLRAATFSVSVPGTKTSTSAEDVAVHPTLWPYVVAAIPSPLSYKALRRHWRAACQKEGVDVRIHDLRHCYGQWAVNEGVPEAKVQSALRHKTPAMTRRYTKTREKGDAAAAVGRALLNAQSREDAQSAAQGGENGRA